MVNRTGGETPHIRSPDGPKAGAYYLLHSDPSSARITFFHTELKNPGSVLDCSHDLVPDCIDWLIPIDGVNHDP